MVWIKTKGRGNFLPFDSSLECRLNIRSSNSCAYITESSWISLDLMACFFDTHRAGKFQNERNEVTVKNNTVLDTITWRAGASACQ